jgi:hypothetical protein
MILDNYNASATVVIIFLTLALMLNEKRPFMADLCIFNVIIYLIILIKIVQKSQ